MSAYNKKNYTIWISSNDKKDSVIEWSISKRQIRFSLIGLSLAMITLLAFSVDYFFAFTSRTNNQKYQTENQLLKSQMTQIQEKLISLQSRLNQIEDFSHKLKAMVGVQESSSLPSLTAMGPLLNTPTTTNWSASSSYPQIDNKDIKNASQQLKISSEKLVPGSSFNWSSVKDTLETDNLPLQAKQLDQKSRLVQQDIYSLLNEVYTRQDILSSTPSILPVRGWISSSFGYRQYPFTGEVSLHEGIDIAAMPGTPVYAPATGEIMFAGYKTGYGNVIIIDHGYRLSTLYGHLSDIMVSSGQRVKRKQVIGVTGNTGHSSGPHLHYEVRIAGVPVDPADYILNEI